MFERVDILLEKVRATTKHRRDLLEDVELRLATLKKEVSAVGGYSFEAIKAESELLERVQAIELINRTIDETREMFVYLGKLTEKLKEALRREADEEGEKVLELVQRNASLLVMNLNAYLDERMAFSVAGLSKLSRSDMNLLRVAEKRAREWLEARHISLPQDWATVSGIEKLSAPGRLYYEITGDMPSEQFDKILSRMQGVLKRLNPSWSDSDAIVSVTRLAEFE